MSVNRLNSPKKTRVMVIYGGRSGEHEISRLSAASVIDHLDPERFEILIASIDKEGYWHLSNSKLPKGSTGPVLPISSSEPVLRMVPFPDDQLIVESCRGPIDVVFPVMHGPLCEDGCIQGLLELADLPYVGSGVLGSAISMDKDVTKRLVRAAGYQTVDYISFKYTHWISDKNSIRRRIVHTLGFPLFVKPANLGSSIGIQKVLNDADLDQAIEHALLYDHKVLIECALDIREIELSVLEQLDPLGPPLVSIPGEVVPQHAFYSYHAKYLDENGAQLKIPADLSDEQIKSAQELARDVFSIVECEGMARVDLFVEKKTGMLFFNEINTIPGFTAISMYPKLFEASGLNYRDLLTHLIDLAIERSKRKKNLKRDFNP